MYDSKPAPSLEGNVSAHLTPWDSLPRLAVPSWVIPGEIADNARFVSGRAAEVGLCFFETEACLAYGEADLPVDLAGLPLSWHVHLPVDLPWGEGGGRAAEVALRLMDKTDFLGARRAVLHLPDGLARLGARGGAPGSAQGELQGGAGAAVGRVGRRAWREFTARWQDSGRAGAELLLENQIGDDPRLLLELAEEEGAGLCLDFSHWLMTSGPEVLPEEEFLRRAALWHLNAPGESGSGHAALTELTLSQQAWAREVLRWSRDAGSVFSRAGAPVFPSTGAPAAAPALAHPASFRNNPLLMLEIFSWEKITASVPLLEAWLAERL